MAAVSKLLLLLALVGVSVRHSVALSLNARNGLTRAAPVRSRPALKAAVPTMGLSSLAGPLLRTKVYGIPVLPVVAAGAAVVKLLDTPQRRYNREKNTVAKEYDAWTEDGVLEHYWGEHIHLGWYSPQEMRDGYKKKVGCPAFWTVAQ